MHLSDLNKIIDTMEVPAFRKKLTMSNIRWLLRNLRIRNAQHAHIDEVFAALKELAK